MPSRYLSDGGMLDKVISTYDIATGFESSMDESFRYRPIQFRIMSPLSLYQIRNNGITTAGREDGSKVGWKDLPKQSRGLGRNKT